MSGEVWEREENHPILAYIFTFYTGFVRESRPQGFLKGAIVTKSYRDAPPDEGCKKFTHMKCGSLGLPYSIAYSIPDMHQTFILFNLSHPKIILYHKFKC